MAAERRRIKPEINVTPLVDVVLVLLIICMVITPQMEGPAVDMPGAVNPDPEEKKKLDTLTLVLEADGDVFLGTEALAPGDVKTRLAAAHQAKPSARVVIKADRAAPFGKVKALYVVCRDLGLGAVSLKVGDPERRRTSQGS
ncbi:biopolymer transporter ExbD [Myxococcota bacterium]|jgi:biopolymer transport protein ExbD|nr:biopolymer transporter ExbD [Myxococcota bacterium]